MTATAIRRLQQERPTNNYRFDEQNSNRLTTLHAQHTFFCTFLYSHCTTSDVKFPEMSEYNSVFSLTWPASMQIYCNKRKRLHKKRVQLPQDWFGTQTWRPFHCFGTQMWPPWRHVKTHKRRYVAATRRVYSTLLVFRSVNTAVARHFATTNFLSWMEL